MTGDTPAPLPEHPEPSPLRDDPAIDSPPTESRQLATVRCVEASAVDEIADTDFGRYVVVTQSLSTYLVDVAAEDSTLIRTPAHDAFGRLEAVSDWDAHTLRRDGEAIPLLGIIKLRVGHQAVFRLDVRGDGIETTRTTTPVVAIRRLPA